MHVRLAKSSTWLLLAHCWNFAAIAGFSILLARHLGRSGFGEYAFIAAMVVIGNMLTTFGTDMHLIREIASNERPAPLAASLTLQIVLSVAIITALWLASPILVFLSPIGKAALRIYSLSLFPLAFFTVLTIALRGEQKMGAYALLTVIHASLLLLVACLVYWMNGDLLQLVWLLLFQESITVISGAVLCNREIRYFRQRWRFSVAELVQLIRASAPLAFLSSLTIIYSRLTPILLLLVGGALQTGLFSAGARFVEAAKTGHFAILTAIYPMMAGQKEDEDLLRTFRAPWIAMFALAGLASLSLFLLADPLIRVLFGLDYSAATPVVRILAWILLPYTVNAFLSLVFLSSGEEATVIRAQIASVSLLAILIIWWGGLYGSPGAAWAALQAEILQAGILLVQAGRRWRTVASHPIWRYE